MAELWGFAAGQSARRQEDMQQSLANMALRKGDVEIQQSEVALESSEIALESQKKMIEMMRGQSAARDDSSEQAPPGGGRSELDDIPNSLDQLAKMALQSGLPQQAAEYASKASTIRTNAAEIKDKELNARIKDLTLASNLLQSVGDEASWKQANNLFAMTTGKPSPFAQMEYSPELVAKIQDTVVTQKERAVTDAARARADASLANASESSARIELIKAQERLTNTRDIALQKAGAKPPKAEDVRSVSDIINAEYMGSVTPEDARILARPIAERMTALMRDDNLPRSQAARRAFNEAQAKGDFGGLRRRTRMAGSKTAPIAMPEAKSNRPQDLAAAQAKLRVNMYYQGRGKYEGQTLLWTGSGFQAVSDEEAEADLDAELEEDEDFDNEHTDIDEGA